MRVVGLINTLFKVPTCNKRGTVCARTTKTFFDKSKCLIPCEGLYATLKKEEVDNVDEKTPGMEEIFEAYEKYKNQFMNDTIYPSALTGTLIY